MMPPLSEEFRDLTIDDAYLIQIELIQLKTAEGATVVGHKVGLTSSGMQELLGVTEPDFGRLLDTMQVDDGGDVDITLLLQPRIEGEIAFLLSTDLSGPGVTPADVVNATHAVAPALEIIDSRIQDWNIKLIDTVADNASSGMYVVGKGIAPADIELPLINMELQKNGDVVGTGVGGATLGDPAAAVAWLANKLSEWGVGLEKGHTILSGALSPAVPVSAGDEIRADFDELGSVSVCFKERS